MRVLVLEKVNMLPFHGVMSQDSRGGISMSTSLLYHAFGRLPGQASSVRRTWSGSSSRPREASDHYDHRPSRNPTQNATTIATSVTNAKHAMPVHPSEQSIGPCHMLMNGQVSRIQPN